MRMNKRKILAIITSIFAMGLLASCSKKEEKIHIRVWETKNGVDQFIKEAAKIYSQEHPEIVVDYLNVGINDMIPTLEKDGPAGIGADIIASPHDNLGTLVSKKLVVPTENAGQVSKKVLGACSKALSYNGTMYGYPACAETKGQFGRRHLKHTPELLCPILHL